MKERRKGKIQSSIDQKKKEKEKERKKRERKYMAENFFAIGKEEDKGVKQSVEGTK